MAKATADTNDPTLEQEQAHQEPEAEFPLTLDEFCAAESQTDHRVELIGGFHYTEMKAGRLRDTPSAYRKRLAAFAKQAA